MYSVLIVEDDPVVASVYRTKLEAEGYTVNVESTGEDGYRKLKEEPPDLLLLDMMLPGLSGADLLVLARNKEEFATLPIVAFTGTDSPKVIEDAKRFGATKVLSKGEYTPGQIVARITEILAAVPKSRGDQEILLQSISEWTPPSGRVLVVEDDEIILALVKDVIEEEGYTVKTAKDGRDAYKTLEFDKNFVAGIFDVNMPFIQGPDLVRHMHTNKRLMKIPVLIMSAEQSLAVRNDSFSAGAAMFLPKPFQRATLRSMFRTLVTPG